MPPASPDDEVAPPEAATCKIDAREIAMDGSEARRIDAEHGAAGSVSSRSIGGGAGGRTAGQGGSMAEAQVIGRGAIDPADWSAGRIFRTGALDGAPFLLVAGPFAMLFGVVATEAGLDLWAVMGFSVIVMAGAAQFTAVQMLQDGAPVLVALAAALAVNLRMAMYSAALAPYLGGASLARRAGAAYLLVDQTYACSILRFERHGSWTVSQRLAHFCGVAAPLFPAWYGFTALGALAGAAVPEWMALDFAMPICFLALIAPMLKSLAHVAAATVSVGAALAFGWMPPGIGLLCAGGLAMLAGAATEGAVARAADRRRKVTS